METSVSKTPELLDENEVASILGVNRRTLQGWRYQGRGPNYVRMSPRCVRYRRTDIERFIQENTQIVE